MYRLLIYCLIFLLLVAFLLSFFHIFSFTPWRLLFSTLLILTSCLVINKLFAKTFKAPSNIESAYITAFILSLIITPAQSFHDVLFLLFASALANASKYILAIGKKHVFNPAAFAAVASGFLITKSASWWVGTLFMAPFVLGVGLLITRKIQRSDLVISFFISALLCILEYTFLRGENVFLIGRELIIYSPLMFFAFIMLTEPATTPPTKNLRILYGMFVGFLFAPFVHLGSIYFSPELALVTGNIFSYLVSPKQKLVLTLKEKVAIAHHTYDFVFHSDKKLKFYPGQYMEWTLGHAHQDSRGIRRYFTIASSPTERDIRVGVKFYEKPSSYKKFLKSLHLQDTIVASQLAGDFTLPKDTTKKLVFFAGGIGITPFRSMVKYLLDTNEKRDIIIFYAAKNFGDIAYREIFDQAQKNLGINTIYILNNANDVPPSFHCESGFITPQMITEKVKDFKKRICYISGPKTMVDSFEDTLKKIGVHRSHIKTDFFPGYA